LGDVFYIKLSIWIVGFRNLAYGWLDLGTVCSSRKIRLFNIRREGAPLSVVASRVQELQAQLESEKQEKSGLQLQVDTLKMHAEESEATMAKQSEEIQNLKKAQEENNNLLRQLISFKQVQLTPP
jgi:septal ring factor EnvC (AmiA/AmiB activator)